MQFQKHSNEYPQCMFFMEIHVYVKLPALDACQMVLATLLYGDWSGNSFYGHTLPSADSRRAVVSVWQKNVHKYWFNTYRPKPP